jgi:hypothetical protein
VSLPLPFSSSLLAFVFLISLIVGYFLCRSPISVDLLLKPPLAVASEETEPPALDLSCSKRMHREDAGGNLGHAKGECHTLQLEASEGGGRTKELVRQGAAPASIVTSSVVAAEAGLTRAGEAILMEIVMPHPAAGEAAAGEVTAADVSSDPISQEDAREVAVKAAEETLVCVGAPEPSEIAARASSSPEPAPSAQAAMPALGTEISAAASPLPFGPLTAWAVGSDCGEASPTPKAAAKDALGEKVPAATAGSGVGSQCSASQL